MLAAPRDDDCGEKTIGTAARRGKTERRSVPTATGAGPGEADAVACPGHDLGVVEQLSCYSAMLATNAAIPGRLSASQVVDQLVQHLRDNDD